MKIVIAEPLRAAGIDILKAQPGWEIVSSSPAEYTKHLADAEVLIASRAGESYGGANCDRRRSCG